MFEQVQAQLIQGYQIASGQSKNDLRFHEGTIKPQVPYFKKMGLDFDEYFENNFVYGTLNLSVKDHIIEIIRPEYFFQNIKWSDIMPLENFYLSKAQVIFENECYSALIYIPDPATKTDHFHIQSTIEVISQRIEKIEYGDFLTLCYNPSAIKITKQQFI